MESAIASCSRASIREFPKKNRSVKKTLVYHSDDQLSETGSIFKHGAQRKAKLRKKNLLENRLDKVKNDKIQDIDLNNYKRHEENIQHRDNTHLINYDDKQDYSIENIYDNNTSQSFSQKESSSTCNINIMDENRAVSPEPNSTIPQDSGIATPENNINIIEHILTESIKKSHKKIKHENRKTSLKAKTLYQKIETAQLEASVQDTSNDNQSEDVKNEAVVESCALNSQNADRPSTPENINSSRLLLSEFKSVKKSHKKDKYSKRISGLAKCHKYHHEYRKKYDNSLQDKDEEKDTSKTSHGNESVELNELFDMSPKKKKKSINVCFANNVHKLLCSSKSLRHNNTNEEFKIYTPTTHRKITPTNRSVINHVCTDEILQEQDKSAENTSKEIDWSRCMTPIARCLKKSRESKDLTCIKKLETDAYVSSDGPNANVADLKDENGRSTPINMSTTELLCNIDSIKKSHKKDKHSRSICKRPVLWKENSYTEENGSVNSPNINKLKQNTFLKHMDNDYAKTGMCSNEEESKCDEEIIYDDPQPSTSQVRDNVNLKTVNKLELNTTPPNDLNATNFIKLLHTISIKKSHKKERDCNAQAKYILMNEEHELSNDGSIFDEEDKLNFTED